MRAHHLLSAAAAVALFASPAFATVSGIHLQTTGKSVGYTGSTVGSPLAHTNGLQLKNGESTATTFSVDFRHYGVRQVTVPANTVLRLAVQNDDGEPRQFSNFSITNSANSRTNRGTTVATAWEEVIPEAYDDTAVWNATNTNTAVLASHEELIFDNRSAIADNRSRIENLESQVQDLQDGVAMSFAAANLQYDLNGAPQLALGVANYSGSTAFAAGLGGAVHERVFLSVSAATTATGGDVAIGAGLTFAFGN